MRYLKLGLIENFIVISDVHLQHPEDKLTQFFLSTLNYLPKAYPNLEAIFLLGDIFDFIAANKNYFIKRWEAIFLQCLNLQAQGIKIYLIEGNHDFGFEHYKNDLFDKCFAAYGDFIVECTNTNLGLINLCHGDHLICPSSYLIFRKFVKSKFMQACISSLIPGWLMQFICSYYAKLSRKRHINYHVSIDFIKHCLANKKIYSQIKLLIIGHIHTLQDFLLDNKSRFLAGPAWLTQANYLVCYEGKIFRELIS